MNFSLYSDNPNDFEKAVLDALLYWMLSNENIRKHTQSPYRVFSFFAKDILQINMNCFDEEYQQKFVIPDHDKYMVNLLKRIEPILFRVMLENSLTAYKMRVDLHVKVKTYHKDVTYNLISTTV